jgi:CubicO group peptidase (beta-lactamase class C family)
MGAALCIRYRGEVVVDLWGGLADTRTGALWQANTPSVIFSCTKGLSAILAAKLVQGGRLDYQVLVTDYWPEFGAAGKESVKVKDLLSHRSGVSAPRDILTPADVVDWSTVVGKLARQAPLWDPDSGWGYHAITHGWLIGEVIRRITGMTVGQYFAQAVSGPLNVDAWIGLPSSVTSRVAYMHAGPTLDDLVVQQAAVRNPDVVDWSDRAMTLGSAWPATLVGDGVGFNAPQIQQAEIPGAGGIATARALATIWSATILETEGIRLLDDATLSEATHVESEGPPVFDSPGPWPRWGMGFQLDSEARRYLGADDFGHDGAGGQVAFADPTSKVGFAFLTNQMEGEGDVRGTDIVNALREVIGSLESTANANPARSNLESQ